MPLSDFFRTPMSHRLSQISGTILERDQYATVLSSNVPIVGALTGYHSAHPDFSHLTLLVFEAVLEVVCVSLPGYVLFPEKEEMKADQR